MNKQIIRWIKIVVMRLLREKNLTKLDITTLISAGMFGYVQALKRFDPNRGVKFKTYAEHRIKGSVLDEVRKMIGDERCKTRRPFRVPDYDFETMSDNNFSVQTLESELDMEKFFKTITLDEREKELLVCRMKGMNLTEISQKFKFSESRASQLLAKVKREVYLYYHRDMNFNFKLTQHICPSCHTENTVSDRIDTFRCDTCDSELRIIDGAPILAVTEDILGEEIDVPVKHRKTIRNSR